MKVEGVSKHYGSVQALDDVSFEVRPGEIFGLIGPNGAGKTTIFNLITGVYTLTEGEISFYGEKLAVKDPYGDGFLDGLKRRFMFKALKPYQIAQKGITRTFQNIRLFKKLTAFENVYTACHRSADYTILDAVLLRFLPKYKKQEKELKMKTERLLKLMGLWEVRDMVSANLPYGMQRKLEIARALALDPKLLLLDEPAAGMNPEETIALMDLIRDIRDKFNLSVLVIEHHMDLIMGLCDKVYVLNFGKFLAEGTAEEVQNDPAVVEAYLGTAEEMKELGGVKDA